MKNLIPLAASLLLLSCATTQQSSQQTAKTDDVPEQKVFRTGSHLPVRDNQVPNVQSDKVNVIMSAPAPYIPNKGGN